MTAVPQPERVIVGNCPECGRVVVVLNNHEVWPWIECQCGRGFDTHGVVNSVRLERVWK